jgi:hypothetical protein
MIYCGNNSNHIPLINGQQQLGTRYGCLNKGKNIGLAQPVDPTFQAPYIPIDNTRKYCGNQIVLPAGYDRFGSLDECYRTGVGIGKRIKATGVINPYPYPHLYPHSYNKFVIPIILFLCFFSIFFMAFYFTKPFIITKNDTKDIDWYKFTPYLLSFSIILILILYFIFR